MRSSESGFSLLEALVTLFIVGALSSAGATMLATTLDGRDRIDEAGALTAGVQRMHASLQADLAQLTPRVARDAYGTPRQYVFAGGGDGVAAPLLAFSRTGRDNPGGLEARGSIAYVEYVLEDDRFIRRMAVRADPTPQTPVIETVLIEGVTRVNAAFTAGGAWRPFYALTPAAADSAGLPIAVEVTLELESRGELRLIFATGIEP